MIIVRSILSFTGTPSNGSLPIGNGQGFTINTLTAGTNITITNGSGTITIDAAGGGGAAGSTNEIQFNNAGTFAADSDLRWIISDDRLVLGQENTADTNSRMVIIGKGISTDNTFVVHNSTGTNNALVVKDDGRVGIGTASPLTRLHIVGGLTETGGELNLLVQSSNMPTIPATITAGSSAGLMSIFAGGLVASSQRGGQIDYYGGGHATLAGVIDFRTGTNTGGTAQTVRARISATGSFIIGGASGISSYATFFSGLAPQNSFIQDAIGNIGIGTSTTTDSRLTIVGGALLAGGRANISMVNATSTDQVNINSSSTGSLGLNGGGLAVGSFRGAEIDLFGGNHASTPGIIVFRTGILVGGTQQTEQARITVAGNLLLGTTTQGTSATKTLVINNGTAPSGNVTASFQQYSANISGAGTAAPHFRTENGNVIKIYQETTGIAAAAFVANTSAIVDDTATYGGYTMGQVVAALKAQGLLA